MAEPTADVVQQQQQQLDKQKAALQKAKDLWLSGKLVDRIKNSIASLSAKIKAGVAWIGDLVSGAVESTAATGDRSTKRLDELIGRIQNEWSENKKMIEDLNKRTNQAILQQAGQQAALVDGNVRKAGLSENWAILTQSQILSQAAKDAAQNEQSNLDRVLNLSSNKLKQISDAEFQKWINELNAGADLNKIISQQAQYLQNLWLQQDARWESVSSWGSSSASWSGSSSWWGSSSGTKTTAAPKSNNTDEQVSSTSGSGIGLDDVIAQNMPSLTAGVYSEALQGWSSKEDAREKARQFVLSQFKKDPKKMRSTLGSILDQTKIADFMS